LGRNARATAEHVYSWERVGERMLETYLSLAQPAEGASPARRTGAPA
jgi:hypothetical protein